MAGNQPEAANVKHDMTESGHMTAGRHRSLWIGAIATALIVVTCSCGTSSVTHRAETANSVPGVTSLGHDRIGFLHSFGVPGRCSNCGPPPERRPTPVRITQRFTLPGGNGTLQPEPEAVQPKVSVSTVWQEVRQDVESCPLEWHIYFGSYSAMRPATSKPDGSLTPWYQNVPAWLILAEAPQDSSCGARIFEPYNASTGKAMGYTSMG